MATNQFPEPEEDAEENEFTPHDLRHYNLDDPTSDSHVTIDQTRPFAPNIRHNVDENNDIIGYECLFNQAYIFNTVSENQWQGDGTPIQGMNYIHDLEIGEHKKYYVEVILDAENFLISGATFTGYHADGDQPTSSFPEIIFEQLQDADVEKTVFTGYLPVLELNDGYIEKLNLADNIILSDRQHKQLGISSGCNSAHILVSGEKDNEFFPVRHRAISGGSGVTVEETDKYIIIHASGSGASGDWSGENVGYQGVGVYNEYTLMPSEFHKIYGDEADSNIHVDMIAHAQGDYIKVSAEYDNCSNTLADADHWAYKETAGGEARFRGLKTGDGIKFTKDVDHETNYCTSTISARIESCGSANWEAFKGFEAGRAKFRGFNQGCGITFADDDGCVATIKTQLKNCDDPSDSYLPYKGCADGFEQFHPLSVGSDDELNLTITANGSCGYTIAGSCCTSSDDYYISDYLIHTSDTNTKMGFPADDTIDFYTAGSARMTIKSDGKIGIGSAVPSHTLTVDGSIGGSSFGISDGKAVLIDGSPSDDQYARFTANGLEGRSASDVRSDLSLGSLATLSAVDADSVTVSNLEVDNLKASTLVTESEGIGSNDNDTTIPTSAAVKDYVDNNDGNVYVSSAAFGTSDGVLTLTRTDSATVTVDLDGRYQDEITSSSRLNANLVGDGSISNTEFDYLDGVSSNIQNQLDAKQATISSSSRLSATLVGANGNVSNTEFGYLDGVTSAIQTQIDGKQASLTFGIASGNTVKMASSASDDEFARFTSTGLEGRSASDVRSDLSLGSLATLSAVDADSVTVSNLEVDNLKASTLVTESEGIGSNDNDTTIPTSAAVKDYVDSNDGNVYVSSAAFGTSDGVLTLTRTDSATVTVDLDGRYQDEITSSSRLNANLIGSSGNVSNTEFDYLDGVTSAIQTQLDAKLSTSGGTLGGNLVMGANQLKFADDGDIFMGDSNDFHLYHNGSHSYVIDNGEGGLYLQTNGPAIYLQDTDGNALAQFTDGGANFLMYDGSTKLETTSVGAKITGLLNVDTVNNNANSANIIYRQGTSTIVGNNADALVVLDAGKVGIGSTSPDFKLEVIADDTSGVMSVRNASNARDTFRSENAAGTRTVNIGNDSNGHGLVLVRDNAGTITNYIAGNGDSYFNAGDVGIGTTSNNAGIGLQLQNGAFYVYDGDIKADNINAGYFASSRNLELQGGSAAGVKLMSGSTVVLQTTSSAVGIGETAPSETLEVAGNILAKDSGVLAGVNGAKDGFIFHDLATGGGDYWGYKGFTSSSRLSIVTDGVERLTVDANGRVGIANTAPSSYTLTVDGSIGGTAFGISDGKGVLVDGSPSDDQYARFTANGIEGRSASDVRSDLSLGSLATLSAVDADSVTVSNLEVDNFKAATIVTESEGIGSNDNDTTIPTSAAVKDYVDSNDGNVYVSSAAFGTSDGVLTLTRTDSATVTVDLDGRYQDEITSSSRLNANLIGSSGSVSNAEFDYLDGVTSAIQTQLDAKLSTSGGTLSGNLSIDGDLTLQGGHNLEVNNSDILLTDNQGAALEVKEGSNLYLRFVTTNGSEEIQINQDTNIAGNLTLGGGNTVDGRDISADGTKLDALDDELQNLSSAEIDYLEALYATGVTSAEFDYLDGVSSNIQTQLDAKQATISASSRLNANLVGDGSISNTEFDYLDGVSSNIQNQLNAKQASLTFGISDGNVVKCGGSVADNDFLRIDGTEVEGLTAGEVKTALSLNNVENTAISTFSGSSNITTIGSVSSGEWNATAIADSYISSASTWNGYSTSKQDTITSGNRLNPNLIGSGNVSLAEFDYLDGVTSAIQTQLDAKQATISSSSRLSATLIGDNGNVSNTEFGYINGVTSAIQTQLDGKQATIGDGDLTIARTSGLQTALDAKQATIDSSSRLSATLVGANGNVSNTEYGYLNGVTSAIQTQLNDRYTKGDIQTFIDNSYISSESASDLAVGWYTIATNTGNRATARFGIWDTDSSRHQSVTFYAAHKYGNASADTITVLDTSHFGTSPFRYIRIKAGGTYDGAALQVYIDNAQNALNAAILGDNFQSDSWVLCDFIPDADTPPLVSNYGSFTESSRIDLDEIAQGGFATTGPIYADGNTSQYKVLTTNDFGISDGNAVKCGGSVADNDFLRIDGTEVEGRTASQVKDDLGLGSSDDASFGSLTIDSLTHIDTDGTYGASYGAIGIGTSNLTNGHHRIFAKSSDHMYFAAASSKGFRFRPNGGSTTASAGISINSSGYLGIGTTNASNYIDVNGGIAIGASYVGASAPSNGAIIEGNLGVGYSSPSYKLHVNGSIVGSYKSFLIDHPTKEGKQLMHSCLEGPEHGVYLRGQSDLNIIKMPDYWKGLVHIDTMSVTLTAIGPNQNIYVDSIAENGDVAVGSNTEEPLNYFYVVHAERKDIDKLEIEIPNSEFG